MKTVFTAASFGLALAAAIFLLTFPVYSGTDGVHTTHRTLVEVNGAWVLAPVAFPVVVALLPLVIRKQVMRVSAAILIGAFSFVGGFSIGLFYFPAAVAMLLASGAGVWCAGQHRA